MKYRDVKLVVGTRNWTKRNQSGSTALIINSWFLQHIDKIIETRPQSGRSWFHSCCLRKPFKTLTHVSKLLIALSVPCVSCLVAVKQQNKSSKCKRFNSKASCELKIHKSSSEKERLSHTCNKIYEADLWKPWINYHTQLDKAKKHKNTEVMIKMFVLTITYTQVHLFRSLRAMVFKRDVKGSGLAAHTHRSSLVCP